MPPVKHVVPNRRNPYKMLENALLEGWQTVDNIPLKGEGAFLVLTISGLTRLARNRKTFHAPRAADGYGPKRTTVCAAESGNYLGAIAWKPVE